MIDTQTLKYLEDASRLDKQASKSPRFQCDIFGPTWNNFVEHWAPKIYHFVEKALGPYGIQPKSEIEAIDPGTHLAGANASFDLHDGHIELSLSLEGDGNATLEKLCHELVHASLAKFPQEDCFYDEGYVDYSVWVLGHAPIWKPFDIIDAAQTNIDIRERRAMLNRTDYDRKRWAGGLFAAKAIGPFIIATLKMKKIEEDFRW